MLQWTVTPDDASPNPDHTTSAADTANGHYQIGRGWYDNAWVLLFWPAGPTALTREQHLGFFDGEAEARAAAEANEAQLAAAAT